MGIPGLNTVLTRATLEDVKEVLSLEEFQHLEGCRWLAYKFQNFLILFVGSEDFQRWEAHWFGQGSAFKALTACQESLKIFFKETGVKSVIGITPCLNKTGLKMAKVLEFKPLGFMLNWKEEVCLVSIKENQ